ncbi:putative bifunctional membrane-associated penicillin-binding protein [Mycobacterium xenopi 3993]|nr:putative bifunctional membrane-associated penicillin-binding protein [Mycobacterium xenopi 3993]
MVIGGKPGISTVVDPIGTGPFSGGGGAGGIPLLVWMVMTEPGMVCPLGEVPTTSPYFALLLTGVG